MFKTLLLALTITLSQVSLASQLRDPASLASFSQSCAKSLRSLIQRSTPKEVSKPKIAPTWGMEIELFQVFDQSRAELAQKLASFFNSRGFESRVYSKNAPNKGELDYFIELKIGDETKVWGVPYEPSLFRGIDKPNNGVEITTAIMESAEDEELLEDVLMYLIFQGMTKASNLGGTHIHLGTNQLTTGELHRIFNGMLASYDEIKKIFKPEEGRSYISQAALLMGTRHIERKSDQGQLVESYVNESHLFFNEGPIRYNPKYKTLELRFFNSTLDFEQLKFNLEFSRRFIPKVLHDDEFYKALPNLSAEEILKHIGLNES